MSSTNTDADGTAADLEARINRLEAELAEYRAENERKDDRIKAVERENADLEAELVEYRAENERDKAAIRRDVHEIVEVRTDNKDEDEQDQAPTLEDVWIAGQPLGKIINSIQTKVNHGHDREGAHSDENAARDDSMTPMERVIRAGEEGVMFNVTASVRRAKAIAEHFGQWATKTPNGLVIKDGLKTLVETATGERLFWKQIERAGHALEKFTKGAIQFKKTRRHGWTLVAQPAFVKQLGRVSSATGG